MSIFPPLAQPVCAGPPLALLWRIASTYEADDISSAPGPPLTGLSACSLGSMITVSVPPFNVDLVGPEALRARALGERGAEAGLEGEEAGVRDHDAVVDAEAL
ncbi:hypothetical protein CHU98_g6401, partial [Xylaria longipes]